MEPAHIAQIIKEGKLKTYYFGTSFIEVGNVTGKPHKDFTKKYTV